MNRISAVCLTVLLSFVSVSIAGAGEDGVTVLTGPYLGQEPPGDTPVRFPFDFMPEGYKLHSAPVFTPDGMELYFSAMDFSVRFSEKIFVMKMSAGVWGPPEVASFSGPFFDGSPSLSGDGRYLFFSSARSMDQSTRNESGDRNIWFVVRDGDAWSSPQPLGFRTSEWENGSDLSSSGNLFFDTGDIYMIGFAEGRERGPVKLGSAVNSDHTELHPCVAADERFLVFYSNRPGHFGSGGGDLYISFKDDAGQWGEAVNLGAEYNNGHLSTSFPRLSPDGAYFFFLKLVSVPWTAEVYWVSSEALNKPDLPVDEDE